MWHKTKYTLEAVWKELGDELAGCKSNTISKQTLNLLVSTFIHQLLTMKAIRLVELNPQMCPRECK